MPLVRKLWIANGNDKTTVLEFIIYLAFCDSFQLSDICFRNLSISNQDGEIHFACVLSFQSLLLFHCGQ